MTQFAVLLFRSRYDPDTESGFAEHEMRAVTFLDDREPLTALPFWHL